MAHNPVNHPARPIYRATGGLVGLYLVSFGAVGVIGNAGDELFARGGGLVLGQGANLGSSALMAVLGLVVLVGVAIGRNVDVRVNTLLGYLFLVLGLGALAVLRTDANIFDFTVPTTIVSMTIGLVLLMAGMYGTVGTDEEARTWQESRLVL